MKVLFTSPLRDFSGYGSFGRVFFKTLIHGGLDVAARALNYDKLDEGQAIAIDADLSEALRKPITSDIEVLIQNTTPNVEAVPKPGLMNGLYFFWETDRLPPTWFEKINQFDFVMVPCKENAQMLMNFGCKPPVLVIPAPCDKTVYDKGAEPYKPVKPVGDRTIFYNICQLSAKKGVDALIRSYYAAFADTPDEVLLVLKIYVNMYSRNPEHEKMQVNQFIEKMRRGVRIPISKYPPILPILTTMSDEEIAGLHKFGDAYVCSSRGEGWCIPGFDALGHGSILISHARGGMADWVSPKNALVYNAMPIHVFGQDHPDPSLYTGIEQWYEPCTIEMAHLMKSFHLLNTMDKAGGLNEHNTEEWAKVQETKKAAAEMIDRFHYENISEQVVTQIRAAYESWKRFGTVEFAANAKGAKEVTL